MNLELYQNRTSLFQSDIWMKFSASLSGRQSYRFESFVIEQSDEAIYISSITKNQLNDLNLLVQLIDYMKDINRTGKKVLIDFQILESDLISTEITRILNEMGLSSTSIHVLPRQRCLVDLSNSMDAITRNYKSKTLSDIKRAEKNGVIIVENWLVDKFYDMYLETSERHNFSPQSYYYFESLCNILKDEGKGKLLFSTKEHYPYFSAAIIAEYNGVVYYLNTGSKHLLNNFNGSSVLQNHIIEWSKSKVHNFYDLMGVQDDMNFGPTKFKLKFGNKIIKLMDAFTLK